MTDMHHPHDHDDERPHEREPQVGEPVEAGRKGGTAMAAGAGAAPVERPAVLDWSAAVWAGIISGAVFLILEMLMVPLFAAGSPWGPPRMIAAIVMGREVLPPPATFVLSIVMVAMAVHFVLSVVYAVILGWFVHRLGLSTALLAGAVFGLALYFINFYGMTAFFPWFAMARNWISIFAHIVFGLVAALAYVRLAGRTGSAF